jgi:hypothetical protein
MIIYPKPKITIPPSFYKTEPGHMGKLEPLLGKSHRKSAKNM